MKLRAGLLMTAVALVAICLASPAFAQSIVVNGEFSSGNSGFSSDYGYVAPTFNALYPEGLYTVGTNPHGVHNNWLTMGDHTTGSGNMFIANGSPSTSSIVWSGTVNKDLTIGLSYDFSAWVVDVLAGDPAPPTLTFKADGVTIGTYSPTGNSWTRLSGTFTALNLRPALTLTNAQPAANGNDFAIDDIEIWYGGAPIPSTLPSTTTLVSSPDPSNDGQTVTLTATVSPSAATGTVTFKEGATTLGTGTVSGGVATMTISTLTIGLHNLTAEYGGDANYDPSSGTDTHTVLAPEIDVQRPAGTSIADEGTDNLGNRRVGVVNLTYTIANAGPGELHVTGITANDFINSSGFSLGTTMPLTIANGGTATFDISFTITDDGPFSFDLLIDNNDPNEDPYDIDVVGVGVSKDYGDAPAPYPTLLADNGARHTVDDRIQLGSTITLEVDGQPSANADADAGDDGVTVPTLPRGVTADITLTVANTTGNQAYMNAWIDWNRDGDWNDAGEQIATDLAVNAGSNTLSVNVPYGATVGESFGLFRLSTQQNLLPTGLASDGEAETFKVNIVPVSVDLISPNGGEWRMGGSDFEIKWLSDPDGISTVTLRYSTDNGATYPNVIASGVANIGGYGWTIPTINSETVKIKVEVDGWLDDVPAAEDDSDNFFFIDSTPPVVNLISPACGDTLVAGDTLTVKWEAYDPFPSHSWVFPVSISYSLDNWTSDPTFLIADNLVNTGEYKWPIPSNLVSDNFEIKVRVVDPVGFVVCGHMSCPAVIVSPAQVSLPVGVDLMLISPLGGEVLQGGSEREIRWLSNQSNGSSALKLSKARGESLSNTIASNESNETVSLKYSTDGGKTYPNLIATNVPDDGYYNWIVPSLNNTQVKVQITLSGSETIVDTSRSCLIIDSEAPEVMLLSPSGGEKFESGTPVKVLWQATDNLSLEKSKAVLWVSMDGGSSYFPSDSIYSWVIPENWKSDRVKIKMVVQDNAGNAGMAETPDCFSASPISITMLSPNGGETLESGTICPIQWTSNFKTGKVDLSYSTDGGANYASIAKDLANSGRHDWTIPVAVSSSSVLVKAEVHSLTRAEDASDSYLTMKVSGTTGVADNQTVSIPKEYMLYQNYPNPFNPETRLQFSLPKASTVLLRVFDVTGRIVRTLKAGNVSAGSYEIVWDGRNDMGNMVSTGIYIARMDAGGNTFMKKMAFMK